MPDGGVARGGQAEQTDVFVARRGGAERPDDPVPPRGEAKRAEDPVAGTDKLRAAWTRPQVRLGLVVVAAAVLLGALWALLAVLPSGWLFPGSVSGVLLVIAGVWWKSRSMWMDTARELEERIGDLARRLQHQEDRFEERSRVTGTLVARVRDLRMHSYRSAQQSDQLSGRLGDLENGLRQLQSVSRERSVLFSRIERLESEMGHLQSVLQEGSALGSRIERLEDELGDLQSVSRERSVLFGQIERLEDELRRLQSISQEKSVLFKQIEHLENELRRLQSISQEKSALFGQIERLENELDLQSMAARKLLSDLTTPERFSEVPGEPEDRPTVVAVERKALEVPTEERRPTLRRKVDFEFGTAEAVQ